MHKNARLIALPRLQALAATSREKSRDLPKGAIDLPAKTVAGPAPDGSAMDLPPMIPEKLIATLLVAISGYTGYAIPGEPPRIVELPHEVLAERVCGRSCQVMAFTWPDGTIMIDGALPIGRDPAATGILVHELTHFLQIRSMVQPLPADCAAWNEREWEAFDMQARWLRDHSSSLRQFSVLMARAGWGGLRLKCRDIPAPR